MPGNNFCLRSSSASSSHVSGGRALSSATGHLKPSQWKYLQIKGPKIPINGSNRDLSTHIVPLALPGKGQEREHAGSGTAAYGVGKSSQPMKRGVYEKRRYVFASMSAHCPRARPASVTGHVAHRWSCTIEPML